MKTEREVAELRNGQEEKCLTSSEKNLIKHLIRWHDKRRVYVCNWAVGITKGKYTDNPKKVTCKNCKKRMWLPK